jgi:steroid Delta-isomerase
MARTSREVAERYVDLVNAGSLDQIIDLYADDGEVLPPNPAYEPVIRGREALAAHYSRSVGARVPRIRMTHLYEAGNTCVIELESQTVDESAPWGIVDIFTVDDSGLITRMAAYRRPLAPS